MSKTLSELTEADRKQLYRDIALYYGRTESARTIANRYGLSSATIPGVAGSMRKHGVNVPKSQPVSLFLTPEFIGELNSLLEKKASVV